MTTAVTAPATSATRFHGPPPAALAPRGAGPTLLPAPVDVEPAELQDAMTMLYMLLNARASSDMLNAEGQINAQRTAKDEAFKEQLDALRRAAAAEGEGSKGFFDSLVDLVSDVFVNLVTLDIEGAITDPLSDLEDMWNSPRFWQDLAAGAGFIAKVALIAGGVAATAATAGAAGPVVAGIALALSASGAAIQETDCLDGLLGEGASDWIGAGMQIAAAAVCVASLSGAAGSWLNTVSTAVNAGGGAALMVTGAARARVAKFEGDAMDAEADATAAKQKGERLTRLIEWLIDGLRETEKSHTNAKETLGEAIQQLDQAKLAAVFTSGRQLS